MSSSAPKPSVEWAMREVLDTLKQGWSGEITLVCQDGGVKAIRDTRTRKPPRARDLTEDRRPE